MTDIRAFVGHSFTAADEWVVDQFCKFFDVLTATQPNFAWDHALAAESKDLPTKVLEKIKHCNVFIGICTFKERVLVGLPPETLFERLWWRPQWDYKTSDWVIQEIGLAVGRAMPIILLVENGVRAPGGLQGVVEYVPFERSAPSEAFNKILQMLASIAPPTKQAVSEASTSSKSSAEEGAHSDTPNWKVPTEAWDWNDYSFAFFLAVVEGDDSSANRIYDAHLNTEACSSNDERARWQAECERNRIEYGKSGGNIAAIEKLAAQQPTNSSVIFELAEVHSRFENDAEAAALYARAADIAPTKQRKVNALRNAAMAFRRADDQDSSNAIMEKIRIELAAEPDLTANVAEAFVDLHEKGDDYLVLGLMEVLSDVTPTDMQNRFTMAYKYSFVSNQDEMSLLHYRKIPSQQRNAITWNNLGVALQSVGAKGEAVTALRESWAKGETLAASNLAQRYLQAGFATDAKAICSEAIGRPDPSPNVASTLTSISDAAEEDQAKITKAASRAKAKSRFMKAFGKASLTPATRMRGSLWKHPDCTMALELTGTHLLGEGSYVTKALGLGELNALMAGTGHHSKIKKILLVVEQHGCAFVGTIQHRDASEGSAARVSLLESAETLRRVVLYLSEKGDRFFVMENPERSEPTFYQLVAAPE